MSQYFDKKRSIATGIISSGSGIGVMAVAPVLQALLDSYGWKKTYRITAGIFSVVFILSLTFNPVVIKKEEESKPDQEIKESENSDEQYDRMVKKPKKVFLDFSVMKEKTFMVLTLCHMLNSLGHNTPRLHLVRLFKEYHYIEKFKPVSKQRWILKRSGTAPPPPLPPNPPIPF